MPRLLAILAAATAIAAFVFSGLAFGQAPRPAQPAAPAGAANVTAGKIAFVDLMKFQQNSKKVKAQADKLRQFQEGKRDALEQKGKEIQEMEEKLRKQGPMLKEETRKDLEKTLQIRMIEIREAEKSAKSDLEREAREIDRIVMEDLKKVVSGLRSERQYMFIVNSGALLSADDTLDITDEVVKRYDAMAASAAPKPAATPAPATRPAPAATKAAPPAKGR